MKRQSLKYLLIVTVNLAILTGLLGLWTDELELMFNDFVRPIEFLKILGTTVLSLIGIRLLSFYFRRKNINSQKLKIKAATILTLLISSYLYANYTQKLIKNVIVNGELRKHVVEKIKPSKYLANGSMAKGLTINEYRQLARISQFQPLFSEAKNIEFDYEYDGFLPDYIFTLIYDVPRGTKVDSFNYTKGKFSKRQSFETLGQIKRVMYTEGQQ